MPRRALRSRRQAIQIPVPQLHQLRSALHDRARRALRPAAHDDGRLRDVPRVPCGVRRSPRPPFPCPAQRLSGVRAGRAAARSRRPAGRGCRCPRRRRGRGPGAARRPDRGREGHRRLPSRVPSRQRARGRGAAKPQAPRGQALRRDGSERRCGPRACRAGCGGIGGAHRPRAPDRDRSAGRRGDGRARRRAAVARGRRAAPVLAAPPRAARGCGHSARDDERQRVGRAHRLPRRGCPRPSGLDRRPVPRARSPDRDPDRRFGPALRPRGR